MQDGERLDLEITDVAHGGVFVARHDGRVVFVEGAIPGERVTVELTDTSKAAFWRADTLEVRDASPHRRPHVWAAADVAVPPEARPGGADFGHIGLAHQRVLKQQVLDDALRRFAGIPDPATTMSPAGAAGETGVTGGAETDRADGLGWRTRVSLHVDEAGRIGPFAARSHRVIETPDLPLATAAIADVARGLEGFEPGRVDLVEPSEGGIRVIVRPERPRGGSGRGADARPPQGRPGRGGRRPARRVGAAPAFRADPTAREVIIERVGSREFEVDAGGFWQVHRLAASTLTAAVRSALETAGGVDPSAHHLDLYGGVGLFAAAIAEAGGPGTRVTSVEADARATEHAGANLAEWVGARAETDRTDRYLARLVKDGSAAERARLARGAVLLDPPRAGAGRAVVEAIAQLAPASVVYVACDPVALARDLGTFRELGYDPVRLDAFDLFPHSHHLETVAVLQATGAPAR
ncbi:class I SAM-dependent RNA methyltransferase [Microbacterium flavum]|uniref:Class I SAM-dependent RNA methyltransferase n=1 Tax=Microbacterium flavum TaxID=415216 RepID=A0ABS5XUI8_9MICO|nr:TRAM domain-containing protein [Microbacterium flavum]MBT8798200.1 class I SAM-dependent RNA methyltransferase [Microbacterium flavum]